MPSPFLSIVCLLKDEAALLPASAASWANFADRVYLFDTGSTDGGGEKARDLVNTAIPGRVELLPAPSIMHFGEAYTRAGMAAEGRWLLFLDADEQLFGSAVYLRQQVEHLDKDLPPASSLLLPIMEPAGPPDEWQLICHRAKCFRWQDGWQFRYAIDPQPLPPQRDLSGAVVPITEGQFPVGVLHMRPSTRSSSMRRNMAVAWAALAKATSFEERQHYLHAIEVCEEALRTKETR
jgi:hypothetical protein